MNIEEFTGFLKQENKFLKNSENISGVKYTVTMQPPELLALRNNHSGTGDNKILSKEIDKYRKSVYCSFVIKDEENSLRVKQLIYNKTDYFKLVGFANVQLQKNFRLVINNESIFCTICHMEPPSTLNPELRIAVAFDFDSTKLYGSVSDGCEVVFEDNIFNNGIIKFAFDKSDLKNWPELKI